MNRKSLLFSILILILGISLLAGCSGGNGKKTPPIEKGPSADYMGLQVGAVLTYTISGTDDEGTHHDNLTCYYKVIECEYDDPLEHEEYFKTEIKADGFHKWGDYFSKNEGGSVYYWRGSYSTDPDDKYDEHDPNPDYEYDLENYLWIENPPKNGIEYEWGELAGTQPELVSVPAGKFKAWKFVDNDPEDDTTVWFVPYLGVVKETSIKNKKIVYERLLIKYSF